MKPGDPMMVAIDRLAKLVPDGQLADDEEPNPVAWRERKLTKLRAENAALTTEVAGLRERLGEAEELIRRYLDRHDRGNNVEIVDKEAMAFLAAGAK